MRKLGTHRKYEYADSNSKDGKLTHSPIYLSEEEILQHTHILGASGTGKSTLLVNLVLQDIVQGKGVVVIDPHGDLVQTIANHIPKRFTRSVVYLDAGDTDYPIRLNLLRDVPNQSLYVASLLQTFKSLWYPDFDAPLIEMYMSNILYTLIDNNKSLIDAQRLLTDNSFRHKCLKKVKNEVVKEFWNDFDAMNSKVKDEKTLSTLNKLYKFSVDPVMRNILGSYKCIPFDPEKVYLINLNVGKIGMANASLLGGLLIPRFSLESLSKKARFDMYIDELQMFRTQYVADLLSIIRKFGMSITVAHQYLSQLPPPVQSSLLGNAGTTIAFRSGHEDAKTLSGLFDVKPESLQWLANYRAYANTPDVLTLLEIEDISMPYTGKLKSVVATSRNAYAQPLTMGGDDGSGSKTLRASNWDDL